MANSTEDPDRELHGPGDPPSDDLRWFERFDWTSAPADEPTALPKRELTPVAAAAWSAFQLEGTIRMLTGAGLHSLADRARDLAVDLRQIQRDGGHYFDPLESA